MHLFCPRRLCCYVLLPSALLASTMLLHFTRFLLVSCLMAVFKQWLEQSHCHLKEFKEGSKSLQVLELCHLCLLEADWAPLETVVMDEEMPEMAPFLSPECCHQIGLWLQKLCQRLKTLLDTHIDIKAHAKDLVKAIALVEAQRLPKWHGAHPSGRKILRLEATIEEVILPFPVVSFGSGMSFHDRSDVSFRGPVACLTLVFVQRAL